MGIAHEYSEGSEPRRSGEGVPARRSALAASGALGEACRGQDGEKAAAAAARVVTGTAGNDVLAGTPRADVIRGLAGKDKLIGGRGADFLQGGAGRDTIEAGPGNDLLALSYDGSRDSALCGAGTDVVNADLIDKVARDCEIVGRRLSRDPYASTDAQHETEVEPDSFTFGRTTVATFQAGRRVDGAARTSATR